MQDVSKEEMEEARDAIIAHAKKHDRTQWEALLIFKELISQLDEQIENNPNVRVTLN